MEATFRYKIDQLVKTPFGDVAIIAMNAVDGEGNQCFVKTASDEKWFKENQLTEG